MKKAAAVFVSTLGAAQAGQSFASAVFQVTWENVASQEVIVERIDDDCMNNPGPGSFVIPLREKRTITMEDSNDFFDGCTDINKKVIWRVHRSGQPESELLTFQHGRYSESIPQKEGMWWSGNRRFWQTQIYSTKSNFPLVAECHGQDCHNRYVEQKGDKENVIRIIL